MELTQKFFGMMRMMEMMSMMMDMMMPCVRYRKRWYEFLN